jgi:glycosyltransferase involved in cell wall biosynthesis
VKSWNYKSDHPTTIPLLKSILYTINVMKKNIMIIIPRLGLGGAELFLANIIPHLKEKFHVDLVCIDGKGILSKKFKDSGIKVYYLNFFSILSFPWIVYKVIKLIRQNNTQVVHSFLYPSDILTIFIRIMFPRKLKIIWSIRLSILPLFTKLTTRISRRIVVLFSHIIPDRVIACGQEALDHHKKIGFDTTNSVVIPNFPPDWVETTKSKSNLLLEGNSDILTVGSAARFTPGKGQELLLEILRINQNDKNALFNLKLSFCGLGTEVGGELYKFVIKKYSDVIDYCSFNGQIIDKKYELWLSSIDLYALTSNSIEGNPNSFLEAVSVRVPIVGTEIGSSALMAAPECLVPLQNLSAETFFNRIKFWVELDLHERLSLIEKNKRLMESNFSKNIIIKSYIENYNLLMKD